MRCWSPCAAVARPGVAIGLAYGQNETAPSRDQAVDQAGRHGTACRHLTGLAGDDHITIVRSLGRPRDPAARLLTDTIEASRRWP